MHGYRGGLKTLSPILTIKSSMIFIKFCFLGSFTYLFEERLEIQSIADDITSKYVPPHVNIFYVRLFLFLFISFCKEDDFC